MANENLQSAIHKILEVLNEKEKHVISARFALDKGSHATLEEIGGEYGITRERVRQIENNALRKIERHTNNTPIRDIILAAESILMQEGGVLNDIELKHRILSKFPSLDPKILHEIHLCLELSQELCFTGNTIEFYALWTLKNHPTPYKEITNKIEKQLKKTKNVQSLSALLKKAEFSEYALTEKQLGHIVINKKSLRLMGDKVGLSAWRHINPKTLKDKLLFILNKYKKPMHFRKLAETIRNEHFDQKKSNNQAVHNELIRHPEFVLVGRGLYGLKKWGYESGTVGDVVYKVLCDSEPKTREEITKLVLKHKMVKEITIYLNLRNHPKIERVGRNLYRAKKD